VYGNAITTAAGFLLASRGEIDIVLFLATVVGLGLVVAGACVLNNYIDRDIDILMARTRDRALVSGVISTKQAITFALLLLGIGLGMLVAFTNLYALLVALLGVGIYVVLYSVWSKRRTTYATLIGSLAGAVPPTVGYASAANTIDLGAVLLFLIFCLWQMPHFYAIAIYRLEDYKNARVPVVPLVFGMLRTKIEMILYILLFMGAASALTYFEYTGYIYLAIALLLGLVWLLYGITGFNTKDDIAWAKRMFVVSLVVNMGLSVTLALNSVLPY
jgi:protoheme IX farnesyltransferase